MLLPSWLRAPRVRRGLAVSAVVLSAGGLVLFHASAGGATPISPLLPTVSPATGNVASFSGQGAHGSLALSHTRVLAGGERDLYAEVRVVADRTRGEVRAPLSLAVVLDTSGSMDGEKIEDARNSVVRLIRDMRDDDEIAVVRYSDSAEIVQLDRPSPVPFPSSFVVKNGSKRCPSVSTLIPHPVSRTARVT